jgi:hypothetical protein
MPPAIVRSFVGLAAKDMDSNPPNVQVAAGPTSLINMVCWLTAIYDKQGRLITKQNGRNFFQSGGDNTEPRALFNPFSQRFGLFSVCMEGCSAMISTNASPTELALGPQWVKINQTCLGPSFFDMLMLGYDASGWKVSFGSPTDMIVKVDYSNRTTWTRPIPAIPGVLSMITATPAQMPDSILGDPYWMMRLDGGGLLRVWRLDSMPDNGGTCTGMEYDVRTVQTGNYYAARQPGGEVQAGPPLGTLIIREIANKNIAFFCAPCGLPTVETAAIFLAVLDLTNGIPVLLRSAVIGTPDLDCWLPSLAVDAQGNTILNFLTSSPTQYIANYASVIPYGTRGIATKVKGYGAPSNTLSIVASSTDLDGHGRAGDISGCVLDFSDNSFWTVNEVPDNAYGSALYNWTSRIANITVGEAPPIPPPNPTSPFTCDMILSVSGQPQNIHVDGIATLLLPPP